jgi:hypothetical protein
VTFKELDVVVVRSLRTTVRPVDGTEGVTRQPRVGDVGTVVNILGPADYIVECVDTDGRTAWVADLNIDELEPSKG